MGKHKGLIAEWLARNFGTTMSKELEAEFMSADLPKKLEMIMIESHSIRYDIFYLKQQLLRRLFWIIVLIIVVLVKVF